MTVSFSTLAFSQGAGSYQDQKSQGSGSYSQPAQQGSDSQYKQPQGGSTSSAYPSGAQPQNQAKERDQQYGNASSGASGDERHDKGLHKGQNKNKNKDKGERGDADDRPGSSRY